MSSDRTSAESRNDVLITSLAPGDVAEILRKLGYRASVVDEGRATQVHSAAQGLGFFVGFGNAVATAECRYVDFALHCGITLSGPPVPGVVESWNARKRFARAVVQGQVLFLIMDVVVVGGVTERHLCAQIELWDRVVRDFILHLNQAAPVRTAGALSAGVAP